MSASEVVAGEYGCYILELQDIAVRREADMMYRIACLRRKSSVNVTGLAGFHRLIRVWKIGRVWRTKVRS